MAGKLDPSEYGGRGGIIQKLSDGHDWKTSAAEQRMVLARQMRAEKGGRVNQVRDPATGNVVGVEPISEEQAVAELQEK